MQSVYRNGKGVEAVLFDVDGVLLDSLDSNCEYYQALFKEAGYPIPSKERLSSMHYLSIWDTIKEITGLTDDADIKKLWDLAEVLEYDAREFPRLADNAREVIPKLSKTYPLGIVTSRNRKFVFEDPLAELERYFKVVVAYDDVMQHKPHPEPLLLAARRLGVSPSVCVYIGDALSDVQAAEAAGMKMIFYSDDPVENIDASASSFLKLPKIIERL